MLRKFLYPRNSTRKKDAFLFILLLFLVTYLAINYLNLMSFSKSFKDAVIETDDSQIKNKLIIRGRELSNRDKSIDTKKTTKPKDKINTEDARKERPVKQQDNKDQGDKKTRLYAIDHSGLGDNSRLIDCSSSLEVELVPDNVDKANFSYYLNGVPPGVENRKQLADGKRHYYMVFAMESEPHSGGGDSWKFGDFHMWYNLDKSFPEPATYFDVRSYLPDLLAPPRVEFEQKETSAPVVWILSNCHAFNQRERFVQKLMNLIKVDSFGGCLNNNRKFSSARMQGNVEVYSKYKFVITIENSNCEDYVTEKLVFSVASGSIPIVAGKDGKPNYLRYLPKGSYINVYDFKTVEDLVKHLNLVGSSKEEYEKYFAFKRKHNYTREYLKSLPLSKQIELGKQILGESDDTKQFFEGLVLKEKSENKVCKVARYLHETPREKVEEDIKANRMNRPSTSEACLPAGKRSNKNSKRRVSFNLSHLAKPSIMINKKRPRLQFALNYEENHLHVPDINERFVDSCENGDYPTVQKILESIKDFNIDVTDNLGRSALRLAVENEHLEVVQALLSRCDSSKMREALLLAIYLGHSQIAESILRHPKYKVMNEKKLVNGDTDSFWQTPSSDDAQFSPDITPLILASQYNRTEIVQYLLLNGDRITKPHDFHCKCTECLNRFKFDSLRHAQSRLNAFRGLASESYISLASIDPILTAFELGHELRILSTKEKYFKNEYCQLADGLSMYTCKLLSNVRGRDELEIVLNKTGKETEEKYERLARLDLAIRYEEKPFVAHSNCQQKLVEIWYTGIRKISKMNQILVALLVILFVFLLPFISIVYIFAPKTKIGKFLSQPCVKFVAHTATYIIFILMIIISSIQYSIEETPKFSSYLGDQLFATYIQYRSQALPQYRFDFKDFYVRKEAPTALEFIITIWIMGLIWHEIKNVYSYGIKEYMRSWNNVVNSINSVLYFCSFGLRYYTLMLVKINITKVTSESFWTNALSSNGTNIKLQKEIYESIYWLNGDRFYWVSMDPMNMAEGLNALANLFSFLRICFILPASQQLGPLQISLGNMISDIVKFMSIFVIIFMAFLFALNNLYWYYQDPAKKQVDAKPQIESINAKENFGTIIRTFSTLFWALFGLGDPEKVKLSPFKNSLTEFFGYMLYGCYHIASIIVLLNMLIASMTLSYEKILKESDIEWKFARSKLYMQFIKEGGTLPVPFNIIPTPKSCYRLIKTVYEFFKNLFASKLSSNHVPPPSENKSLGRRNYSSRNELPLSVRVMNRKKSYGGNEGLTYTKVMQRIVKRFLLHKQRESDEIGEIDFAELKQDLQMVRFELLNDLKRFRDGNSRFMSHLTNGISIIGDEVFRGMKNENTDRFAEFKTTEIDQADLDVLINSYENNNRGKANKESTLDAGLSDQATSSKNPSTSSPQSASSSNVSSKETDMTILKISDLNDSSGSPRLDPSDIDLTEIISTKPNHVSLIDLNMIKEEDDDFYPEIMTTISDSGSQTFETFNEKY